MCALEKEFFDTLSFENHEAKGITACNYIYIYIYMTLSYLQGSMLEHGGECILSTPNTLNHSLHLFAFGCITKNGQQSCWTIHGRMRTTIRQQLMSCVPRPSSVDWCRQALYWFRDLANQRRRMRWSGPRPLRWIRAWSLVGLYCLSVPYWIRFGLCWILLSLLRPTS